MLAIAVVLTVAAGFGLWLALGKPRLGVAQLDARERLESIKVVLALVGAIGGVR